MIEDLSPEDLLILANTIAITFSEGKTDDEINVPGNFIVGVGSLMLTFAAQNNVYLPDKKMKNLQQRLLI